MDRIHPIVPRPVLPAAVDGVRRVARAGDDARREDKPGERRRRPDSGAPVAGDAVHDGHLDARV